MPQNNDLLTKAFAQFDEVMSKTLSITVERFAQIVPPDPPKRKRGKKVIVAQQPEVPFNGSI